MTAIPTWLQGRHVSAITITPQNVASDGTLSAAGTASLYGKLNAVRVRDTPAKENISPVTTTRANMVIAEDQTTFELEVILSYANDNDMTSAAANYDIFFIAVTAGSNSWQFYGSRGDHEWEIASKGKNTARLVVDQIDVGTANPVYS